MKQANNMVLKTFDGGFFFVYPQFQLVGVVKVGVVWHAVTLDS
jgi:hypothetical protein